MLACASLSFSPCPPTRKAGQSQKPAWRWQFRLRWENPKKIELWPALLHVTTLECWRFIFFLWRTVPSQWVLQASLNPVSVSTTVSRFPMGVFLLVIGRGLPGSLFIIWPESLKGNPFPNVSYGAVWWAIYHCPPWRDRRWASSLLKGCAIVLTVQFPTLVLEYNYVVLWWGFSIKNLYFIDFNYMYTCGSVCRNVPVETRHIRSPWRLSYRQLWANRYGYWEWNSGPLGE